MTTSIHALGRPQGSFPQFGKSPWALSGQALRLGAPPTGPEGQTLPALRPGTPSGSAGKTVYLSREEADLVIRSVEEIITFANDNPLEFHAYCPPEDWQSVLDRVGRMTNVIEQHRGGGVIAVPADGMLALFDLEECLIGVRDTKLSSLKTSLIVSSLAAIGGSLLGLGWLSLPAYLVSLGIVFGKPLLAAISGEKKEPFRVGDAGACPAAALGHHTEKGKVTERTILPVLPGAYRHPWGTAVVGAAQAEEAACLAKGRFHVRVEGWQGQRLIPGRGWELRPLSDCEGSRHEIVVWEPCGVDPRRTSFGPVPKGSGFAESFWVEYIGPFTNWVCRRAGPFG